MRLINTKVTRVEKSVNLVFSVFAGLSVLIGATEAQSSTSVTRVDAYDYETTTGLPSKQIAEPGDNKLCTSTVLGYDPYGNKKTAVISNCAGLAGTYPGSSSSTNTEAAAPGAGNPAPFTQRSSSSVYTYNADGTVKVVATNAENESATHIIGVVFGQLLSSEDANNLITRWAYDGLGRKTLEVRPDGNGTVWTYEYCSGINGGQTSCPTQLNTGSPQQVAAYPAYVVTELPVAGPINYTAQTFHHINGAYTKTYYDVLNRPIRIETQGFDISPVDGTSSIQTKIYLDTTYDSLGRTATVSRPYYSTDRAYVSQTQYDNLGRAVQVTAADGSKTKTTYNGLATTVVNDLNQATIKTRNEIGQVVQVTDNYNKTLTLAYDGFGNLLQSTDSANNSVKMQYDARGRKYAMQDPDMGSWTYAYNAVGNLTSQTDAKSQTTTFVYDRLDRLTSKAEPNLNTNWYYGKNADNSACPKGIGKLCQATADNQYDRKHTYDSLGRASTVATKVVDTTKTPAVTTTYTQTWAYNSDGRLLGVTYPSGLVLQTMYTPLGFTWKLMDNVQTPTVVYWKAKAMDAEQHLTQQTYGNNVVTTNDYFVDTGRLKSTVAGSDLQNVSYTYDTLGNLKTRNDGLTLVNATYGYDDINRLKTETLSGGGISGQQVITWAYDTTGIGNIQSRTDVGTYAYNPSGVNSVRPHAVTNVTGTVNGMLNPVYGYDENGNLKTVTASSGGSKTITWTSYNMVASASRVAGGNTNTLAFQYGPEYDRFQETYTKNGVLQRTISYFNSVGGTSLQYEEEWNHLTLAVTKTHYLNAGGSTIGVIKFNGSTSSIQYWHKDQLGSPMVLSGVNGLLVERLAYEPFGKRRNANGTTDASGTLTSANTQRGFTQHEMLDEVGLINMNGRVYDPAISRFLSPDTTVQAPNYLQAYNRYSYVMNNPLKMFDPTGFTADYSCDADGVGGGTYGDYSVTSYSFPSSGTSSAARNYSYLPNTGTSAIGTGSYGINLGNGGAAFSYTNTAYSPYDPTNNAGSVQLLTNSVFEEQARCAGGRCSFIGASPYNFGVDSVVGRTFATLAAPFSFAFPNNINPFTGYSENFNGIKRAEAVINIATFFIPIKGGKAVANELVAIAAKEAPLLFRGGASLEARLGVDVKAAADGLIYPMSSSGKAQGLSLNANRLDTFIQKYGGAFPVNNVPDGLQILQSGKAGHFVISPTAPMSFEAYQQLLNRVELGKFNLLP